MASLEDLKAAYETKSAEFTELNKEYNRALRKGEMTDELELNFLRTERALKQQYEDLQRAAAAEASTSQE